MLSIIIYILIIVSTISTVYTLDESSIDYKELINNKDNEQTNYGTFRDSTENDKKCKHYALYIASKDHLY